MDDQKHKHEQKQVAVNVNLDTTPILYTDNIFLTTNEDGLVLDVCQKIGPSNQLRIVSRIGMSRVHAKKFLKELGNLLAMTEGQIQTGIKKKLITIFVGLYELFCRHLRLDFLCRRDWKL